MCSNTTGTDAGGTNRVEDGGTTGTDVGETNGWESGAAEARPLRAVLALFGGTILAVGAVAIARPSFARGLPVEAVLGVLGNAYVLVAIFGGVAMLVVLAVLGARAIGGINQTSPPDPEEVHPVPRFGESFDAFVDDAGIRAWLLESRHEEVRTRLRESAIATVMHEGNCTRSTARERIDRAEWTDDPEVGAFLADSTEAGDVGLGARVLAALRGESPFQRAARRSADEIARYDGEENP